ncbi:Hypothetical protein SMAX5B_016640 [Scophthalmus maximus]|uniref:Uncharacterized protein n=1 Tax=Scophthalmus maximus TaxID=52904 RepID=A0A2U9B198_SCOMX|nr:Hypothetical protein SMAX5B_016640 [Scophthalmus maximus]
MGLAPKSQPRLRKQTTSVLEKETRGRQDHLAPQGHRALLGLEGLPGTQAKMGPEAFLVYQAIQGSLEKRDLWGLRGHRGRWVLSGLLVFQVLMD